MKDNIIQLPVKNRLLKIKNTLRLRFDLEQRKIVTSASIISILFLVAVVNDHIIAKGEQPESRSIASYGTAPKFVQVDWEANLAKQLSNENPETRGATFATRPTLMDQLAYGPLEGKYSLKVYRGRVQEIQYANQDSKPSLISDRVAFLTQSRDLWPVQFRNAVKTNTELKDSEMVEHYALQDEKKNTIAKVQFHLDMFGRLISMRVDE